MLYNQNAMRRPNAALGSLLLLALPLAALAQSADSGGTGSISGRVIDAATGSPVPGADIRVFGGPRQPVTTDAEGRYRVEGLEPRRYWLRPADQPFYNQRAVTLQPGEELDSIDLRILAPPTISGVVTDDQGEPLEGVRIGLYSPQYHLGQIEYFKVDSGVTDDLGLYRLERNVHAGRSYVIRAAEPDFSMAAVSDEPKDPEARREALIPTYYPAAPIASEAATVLLREAEQREQINIRMLSAPSLCAEAVVEFADSAENARFWIQTAEPAAGMGPLGGTTNMPNGGQLGADGRLRICGLHPAAYRLTALTGDVNSPASLGSLVFSVTDRDITDLVVTAQTTMPVSGRFEWVNEPPDAPEGFTGIVALRPRHRGFGGIPGARIKGIGDFDVKIMHRETGEEHDPLIDEYSVMAVARGGPFYVKDVLYSGESVLGKPLVLGSAIGDAQLRVLVGHDAGTFRIRALDADGEPAPDAKIYFIRKSLRSLRARAATDVLDTTDQRGELHSRPLEPGVYYVVATHEDLDDRSPDGMARLWSLRHEGVEVTLDPNSEKEISVTLLN